MTDFQQAMQEYRSQLQKGAIQAAYRGLMDYVLALRTHFKDSCPEYSVPGSVYFGYMDMTYFSIVPESLKQRGLKIALVFLHQEFRFEVWLSGYNRQVQSKYWKLIRASGWDTYRLTADPQAADAVLEHILVEDPDFGDLDALTAEIERKTLSFIQDVEAFLSRSDA